MPRTTDAAVKEVIETPRNTLPFIATAAVLVERYAQTTGVGVDETTLERIECYWAAHLVALTEPRATRRTLGETTVEYRQGTLGSGLMSTFFGQTVVALDPTGSLAADMGAPSASFRVE
jgi:hypothetical protein